jgi:hypothetical protein
LPDTTVWFHMQTSASGGKPLPNQKSSPQSVGCDGAKNIPPLCPKSPLRVPLVDEGTNSPECPAAIKMLLRR